MNIDPEKVQRAAQNGIPLVVQTSLLPPHTENELEEILGIFLNHLGRNDAKAHLAYCLRELTGNAKKANTKRVFFHEKKLDLFDQTDYIKGMTSFKRETLEEIDRYLELQDRAGLHIRVTFLLKDAALLLRVTNNTPLTPGEKAKAAQRIERARAFHSMEEAFDEVLDESEGAGLGITILILMLRKMGLTEQAFRLESTKDETTASLWIPAAQVHIELVTALTEELVAVVDSLPPFPENLKQLLKLLDRPGVTFEDLAARLSLDPALTSDLIRYINSAGKGRKNRVTNLRDAVQLVGLHGIRDMILPYGAQKLLDKFISQQKILWAEAQRISFLAEGMARLYHSDRQDRDLAQIGGLLSPLGRIVVSYLHPQLDGRIKAFCREKKISPDRFNDLTQTINPAELGARVAEKWEFPVNLIEVLRHQAWPDKVPANLHQITCIIHLAARLNSLEQNVITVSQIEKNVLETLKLIEPGKLEALRSQLDKQPPAY